MRKPKGKLVALLAGAVVMVAVAWRAPHGGAPECYDAPAQQLRGFYPSDR